MTTDAQVTGGLEVRGERAVLVTNASITAYDHSARITLDRGGQVNVCATSQFHLLRSGSTDSLLFGLDRGAIEVLSSSRQQDTILTPDFRFGLADGGVFDLRLRVTRNGDTCVENRGSNAPILQITEAFGSASYRLLPNQHVLFEHGSLKEVVDNERSPCGCPVETQSAPPHGPLSPSQLAEAQHPFPAAQSQDLAPPTSPAGAQSPQPQTQVAASLAFSPDGKATDSTSPAAPATTPSAAASAQSQAEQPPPAPPGARDLAHVIGRFFRRVFRGKPKNPDSKP